MAEASPSSEAARAEAHPSGSVITGAVACGASRIEIPFALVIFGATGDLTARKLFPALGDLARLRAMPEKYCIIGVSRSDLSDEEFRSRMRKSLEEHGQFDQLLWENLAPRLFYFRVQPDNLEDYKALAGYLRDKARTHKQDCNRVFHLAVPPEAYETIAWNLGRAGLASEAMGFSRIVIEKPFGRDLETAKTLDRTLRRHFQEHQIFRIDHYLAKETVQNILMLRFANSIFEPIWNRRYIQHIRILAAESIGVGHRAVFYDKTGVLRDMFQNHMMQLLALCAMEPPPCFDADRLLDEKAKVYRALRPIPEDDLRPHLVLGQYSSGVLNGEKVSGYLDEKGVSEHSLTPTFATLKVYVDNWRWQGVPFYITSGKRLAEKRTEIVIQFKEVPVSMFRHVLGEPIKANRLTLGIQPSEDMSLTFQAKSPGTVCLRGVTMHFDYKQGVQAPNVDAYVKVISDVLAGDQTLFWRQDAVELCWSFLTPILKGCECPERAEMLHLYKAGSWGPVAVKDFMPDGTFNAHIQGKDS